MNTNSPINQTLKELEIKRSPFKTVQPISFDITAFLMIKMLMSDQFLGTRASFGRLRVPQINLGHNFWLPGIIIHSKTCLGYGHLKI